MKSEFNLVNFSVVRFRKMTPGKVTTSENAPNADSLLSVEVSQKDETLTSETKDVKKTILSFESDISNSLERNENKNNETAQKVKIHFDEKIKSEVNNYKILWFK